MNFLSSIISDNSGGGSSLRVLMLVGCFVILAGWGYVSVKTAALAPIPESVLVVFGSLLTSKLIQRPMEKAEPEQPKD